MGDYLKTASFGIRDKFLYIGITDKAYKGYLSLYSKHSKKIMTAKRLVDDMYLKGNVITVTGKRIPHNMDGNDIIWEIKPRILMKDINVYPQQTGKHFNRNIRPGIKSVRR